MIRALQRWLRTWIRPIWFLPLLMLSYFAYELLYVSLRWRQEFWNPAELADLTKGRDLALLPLLGLAGALRATSHHPLFWTSYGKWLVRTPWQVPKRLPLGPIHLSIGDFIFLAVAVVSLHNPYFSVWRAPLVFLVGYLSLVCWSMCLTKTHEYAYLLAFGLGVVARLWMIPWAAAAVAALIYVGACVGLRRSLAGFPWSRPESLFLGSTRKKSTTSTELPDWLVNKPAGSLGWPFDLLRPNRTTDGIDQRTGVAISLLIGWWVYAILDQPWDSAKRAILGELLFLFVIPTGMAFFRTVRYCTNYAPPISLWGRLVTRRWIIPGYDKVLVAPLMVVVLTCLANAIIQTFHLDSTIPVPIVVALLSMLSLNMGPSLDDWRHTGNHRIVQRLDHRFHLRL